MPFATDVAISKAVREVVRDASTLKLAVAFWGKGAVDLLGLDTFAGRAQIVCDAYSGACNPNVLALLMEKHDVREITGMHAKVYWSPKAAIVGSANASINGLRSEAATLRYEAAIETREPAVLSEIETWFDSVFNSAKPLDERSLEDVRKRWKQAQASRLHDPRSPDGLLQALIEMPSDLANRRVFVMVLSQGDPSEKALAAYDHVKGGLFRPEDIRAYQDLGTVPFYEDWDGSAWDVRPNEVFIDFNRGPRGSLTFGGLWQVRNNRWRHASGEGTSIVLVDQVEEVEGKVLANDDARKLGNVLKGIIRANKADFEKSGSLCEALYDLRKHFDETSDNTSIKSSQR